MIALAQPSQLDIILNEIIHGEALAVLKTLPECCIDSIVCDPPAGISFMGREFDHHRGGRDQWIAWLCEIMTEALRCLKPGGHAFVWALPRTSHWTATALEDAGFEIRDVVVHLFGSGFPKSHDISKAIDRMKGAEREVIGISPNIRPNSNRGNGLAHNDYGGIWEETKPATPEALAHAGEGTALKPAHEHWILCRKPLSEPTIAANVLKWGTGALRIDDTRIEGTHWKREVDNIHKVNFEGWGMRSDYPKESHPQGRWPANVILTHSLWCVPPVCSTDCPVAELDRQSGYSVSRAGNRGRPMTSKGSHEGWKRPAHEYYTDGYSPISDQGGASRYFHTFTPDPFIYQPKPSRRERNNGCEGLQNDIPDMHNLSSNACGRCGLRVKANGSGKKCECGDLRETIKLPPTANSHPTVKSISLMRHLIRQITPPGGIVLDCFAGSGSTLVAAIHERMYFIGIEMNDTEEEPYVTIARARIEQARREVQYA